MILDTFIDIQLLVVVVVIGIRVRIGVCVCIRVRVCVRIGVLCVDYVIVCVCCYSGGPLGDWGANLRFVHQYDRCLWRLCSGYHLVQPNGNGLVWIAIDSYTSGSDDMIVLVKQPKIDHWPLGRLPTRLLS